MGRPRADPGIWPVNPFFFLIGLTYALTVPYALTLKYVDRHRWLVDLQLAADALTVSAMVFMTGGVTSYFRRSTYCRSWRRVSYSFGEAGC